jgi:hypothetical protein
MNSDLVPFTFDGRDVRNVMVNDEPCWTGRCIETSTGTIAIGLPNFPVVPVGSGAIRTHHRHDPGRAPDDYVVCQYQTSSQSFARNAIEPFHDQERRNRLNVGPAPFPGPNSASPRRLSTHRSNGNSGHRRTDKCSEFKLPRNAKTGFGVSPSCVPLETRPTTKRNQRRKQSRLSIWVYPGRAAVHPALPPRTWTHLWVRCLGE